MNDSKRKRENEERASISIFIPEQKPTMKKWKSGGRCRNANDVANGSGVERNKNKPFRRHVTP